MHNGMSNTTASSVIQLLRKRNINHLASVIEINVDIWRLVELIRKLRFDQNLLLYQAREFIKLVFDKLALESSSRMAATSSDMDMLVIRVLISRINVILRHLDSQTFDFSRHSPALLSWKPAKAPIDTHCRRFHFQHLYVSESRARKCLVNLQAEQLRLNKSSYAIKQLLLRFDEDNALLRHDVALLRQRPPALDATRALETWNKLARVELCFISDSEKRRSLASQRRMSAISTRRLSMTGHNRASSLRGPLPLSGRHSMTANAETGAQGQSSTMVNNPESMRTDPSRYRLSKASSDAPTDSLRLQHHSQDKEHTRCEVVNSTKEQDDVQTLKRMSILSMGKRSGAILSDWKWNGDDSDDEGRMANEETTQPESDGGARAGKNDLCDASLLSLYDSSVSTYLDSQSRSTRASSVEALNNTKALRPRSFIAPQNRYSMYDQYGRKQPPVRAQAAGKDGP